MATLVKIEVREASSMSFLGEREIHVEWSNGRRECVRIQGNAPDKVIRAFKTLVALLECDYDLGLLDDAYLSHGPGSVGNKK